MRKAIESARHWAADNGANRSGKSKFWQFQAMPLDERLEAFVVRLYADAPATWLTPDEYMALYTAAFEACVSRAHGGAPAADGSGKNAKKIADNTGEAMDEEAENSGEFEAEETGNGG